MKTLTNPTHSLLQSRPAHADNKTARDPFHPSGMPGRDTAGPASRIPWDPGADPGRWPADWGSLLERYHKGDRSFFHLLCCKSQPLVDTVSRKQYYANALGREEAYSIAAMSMVSFWNRADPGENAGNLPGQLYHAMECDLLNQIRRQETRRSREVHVDTDTGSGDSDNDVKPPAAGDDTDPEQQLLESEWKATVRSCLQFLGKKECQVIHRFFFRQLTVTEIAAELHCSPDSVTSAKRHALKTLRRIFTEKQINRRLLF